MSAAPLVRRTMWLAPRVERIATAGLALLPNAYENGVHYSLLQREPGSERHDLPIWVSHPGTVVFEEGKWGPVERTDVPGVPGAFVLSNVLTCAECDQLRNLSEAMGYTEDAPVSLGRRIRRNENCVWIADDSLWRPVWSRVVSHMPPRIAGGGPAGLNQRWRLYKYGRDDTFRMHTDGSWPGSAVDPRDGRLARDAFGDRWSQLTLLLYLDPIDGDGGYDGGETTFWVPDATSDGREGELVSVRVPQGGALAFFHGEHPLSLLHEGSLVTRGVKRIVRTDVLYMRDGQCADALG